MPDPFRIPLRRSAPIVGLLCLLLTSGCFMPVDGPADGPLAEDSVVTFLDTLQARTFRWYWEATNPETGMVPGPPVSSIASTGFGLTTYGVGVERGYVTREQAAERTLTTLRFLWDAPMSGEEERDVSGYRGFYYHFIDMETGLRFRNSELSSIDTACLLMGVLFAQEYFDGDNPEETEIRALADSLYLRVEWDWMQPDPPLIGMAWWPDRGLHDYSYEGFNEAMFLYVIAMGSPTHPASADAWDAFTSTYEWGDYYGAEYVQFTPLFGYQYSHVWIDPRGLQDAYLREKGIDYFENSRRATLANRAYCIDNPRGFKDYGENVWGLTACQGPAWSSHIIDGDSVRFWEYAARGASLRGVNDDGTIAPWAAGASVPFAPEETITALMTMAERYGDDLYDPRYGFKDAFNPTFDFEDAKVRRGTVVPGVGWFDSEYIGIDQGPMLLMIENYRSSFVWEVMRDSPYIIRGLCRAGFSSSWLEGKCQTDELDL